jgi:hypothetical protein
MTCLSFSIDYYMSISIYIVGDIKSAVEDIQSTVEDIQSAVQDLLQM